MELPSTVIGMWLTFDRFFHGRCGDPCALTEPLGLGGAKSFTFLELWGRTVPVDSYFWKGLQATVVVFAV